MCFSTQASLTAAVLLGVIGCATLKINNNKSTFFLAALPLLFSLQQLSEGLIWLNLEKNVFSATTGQMAQYLFLFFAFIIWPIWIPFALLQAEKISLRRTLLYANLGCGVILSSMNFIYALNQPISVKIINHSLQYLGTIPNQTIYYPLIVLFPFFISSLKNVWIYGFLVAIGYIIADYSYQETFVSVWCFFAALVSLSIYKLIKDNQTVTATT